MNRHFDPITYPPPSSARSGGAAIYDEGLRRHMLGVYRNMALGLGITALVALLIASTPALYQPIFGTPLKWVAIFAPLAFVLLFSFRVERMTTAGARTAFYAFAAVMGVSMASIFLVFTGTSIALAFVSSAAVFAGMSLWGYTTNVDLSRWSTFLMVGLIGVVIASLVNLFIGSSTLQLVFSIAGVLVFTGLTAWDTQRLKSEYLAYAGTERADKLAVMGALSLYLNLINLFQLLLSLFGQRESDEGVRAMTSISAAVPHAGAGSDARTGVPLLNHNWGWFVVRGVLALTLGVVAFLFPVSALFAFAMVFAAYAGADGLLSTIAGVRGATRKEERWWMLILRGIIGLAVAVAVLFLAVPFASTASYALATLSVLSAWAILTGVLEIAAAIRLRKEMEGEWLLALSGVLSLLLGLAVPVALYLTPPATIVSVAWVIAIYAVIASVVLIGFGLRLRRRPEETKGETA